MAATVGHELSDSAKASLREGIKWTNGSRDERPSGPRKGVRKGEKEEGRERGGCKGGGRGETERERRKAAGFLASLQLLLPVPCWEVWLSSVTFNSQPCPVLSFPFFFGLR